jgi:VWFA-related protein
MMPRRLTRLLAVTLSVALRTSGAPGAQQSDAAQTPAEEQPPLPSAQVEKVEVRLVQIPVIAQDRNGRPITDLTTDEIVVKEGGQKLKVAFLDPFVSEVERPGPDGQVRLYVGAPGGWDGVVTSAPGDPRYMVIFIDIENDQKLTRPEAMQDVLQFVDEELDPSFRTAVMSYDGEVHQEVTFTSDKDAVRTGVQRAYARTSRPQLDLTARIQGLIRELQQCEVGESTSYDFERPADETCLRTVALQYADEHRPQSEDYVHALEGVVRYAGGLKGRKSVLAVSHGVAVDTTTEVLEAMRAYYGNTEQLANLQLYIMAGEGARVEMDELMALAVQQQVTLNFVDRTSAPSGVSGAREMGMPTPGARPYQAAFEAAQTDLEEIATHTGGVFRSTPQDLLRGLKQAIALEAGGYMLGYYVEEYFSPKRLRRVNVDTTRKGVQLVHRRGYYSQPTYSDTFRGSFTLGAPLRLEGDGRPGQFQPFTIVVDPKSLGYSDTGAGEALANLTLHVRVETFEGRPLADSYHFLTHSYPIELWNAADIEPMMISGWAELPPYDYRLVAVVRNARSGIGGEVSTTLSVKASPPAPSASTTSP